MSDLRECVLVVDDEALIAELWCLTLERMGLEVCGTAPSADVAVALAEQHRPKLVLMDIRLQGDRDGVDAALAIERQVGSRIIFITGSKEQATSDRIALCQATTVLYKPISFTQLETTVRHAFATSAGS